MGITKIELGIIAAIILIIILVPFLVEAKCKAKTEGIGLNVDWSFLGGCRIEHKQGAWIPLERYRVVED